MSMSKSDATAVVKELRRTLTKGVDARWALLVAGREDEAKQVKAKNNQLRRKIDEMMAVAVDEWRGQAKTIIENGKQRNRRLQDSIRDIEKNIKIADRVVKVVGYLDEAIQLAAKILAQLT